MTRRPIIEVEQMRFRWRRANADILDIDELNVLEGEKIFIKGPSGSGKTTLLSLLGGVIMPQRGSVRVLGIDLSSLSKAKRDSFRAAHVGFIFQMFNLIPYLSVVENVTLPCRFSRARHDKAMAGGGLAEEANRLLSHLELQGEGLLSRPVTDLSVGQQQRVAAARALIGRPELIIADEPTSSLDADAKESFLALLLQECRGSGSTLLFVSHDAALGHLFDRSLALHEINRATRMN